MKMEKRLNEKDKLVIRHLRKNSRMALSEVARQTGVALPSLHLALGRLKSRKVITRHVSILDFRVVGFGIRSFLYIKANDKSALSSFLLSSHNINTFQKISGEFDYHVDAVFRSLKELEDFKETILEKGAERLTEHQVTESLKTEGAEIF